jgi:hypothetical protein
MSGFSNAIKKITSTGGTVTITSPVGPTTDLEVGSGLDAINQLTGDVTAGPGVGSQAATLVGTTNVESIITANTTVAGALQVSGGTMTGAIQFAASGGALTIDMSGTDARNQVIEGTSLMTGLAVGNDRAPIVLQAANAANLNSPTYGFNLALVVNNYTATGAGISVGNLGQGDGIYAQTTGTATGSGASNAINVFSGTAATPTAVGTGINIQRYGVGVGLNIVGESGSGTAALVEVQQGTPGTSLYLLDTGDTTLETIAVTLTAKTSGNAFNVYHATSTMSGAAIQMNMGNSAGSFTGKFMSLQIAGSEVFNVNASGSSLAFSAGLSVTAPTVAGTTASAPPSSNTVTTALGTLALGTAFHNTLSYDIVITVYLAITANTSLVVKLGIGTTTSPTQATIITGSTALGIVAIPIPIPAGYYGLLSSSGTGTDALVGQIITAK